MADFLLCEFLKNILATFFNVIKVNEDGIKTQEVKISMQGKMNNE